MRKKLISALLAKFFFFTVLILFFKPGFCQTIPDSAFVDLSRITKYEVIRDKTEVAFLSPDSSLEKYYPALKYQKGSVFKKDVAAKFVNRKLILRFHILNPANSVD